MNISKVQGVLFDLDGTLYHQAPLRLLMGMELCTLPLTVGSITKTRAVIQAIKRFRTVREELRGLGCPSESLDDLQYRQPAADIGMDPDEMKQIVSEWMYHRPLKYLRWCRRKGVIQFFAEARQRGMRIGVFSDYPACEKLKALGLESYVQLILCATDHDVNAFKPHPRGFLRACEEWGLTPEQVLYVGDRTEVDAEGASAAGMGCMIVGQKNGKSLGSDQAIHLPSFHGLQQQLQI